VSAAAERLAELTWRIVDGDFAALERLVRVCGGSWEEQEDGTRIARTGFGVTVGFGPGLDPISAFVQVAMAVVGPYWVWVPHVGEAMRLVGKQWAAASKPAARVRR
jgi:hypothetical protein